MARTFNGSTQYLLISTPVVSSAPLTAAVWFATTDNTTAGGFSLLDIADEATTTNYFRLSLSTTVAGRISAQVRQTGSLSEANIDIGSFAANTWYHAASVQASSTSRYSYANGVPGTQNTNDITPAGLDNTTIGALKRTSVSNYLPGSIAHAAVWSAALTDPEVASLYNNGRGLDPRLIRPQSLVAYWPLVNSDRDIVGKYNMTAVNGPTWTNSGPVIRRQVPHLYDMDGSDLQDPIRQPALFYP